MTAVLPDPVVPRRPEGRVGVVVPPRLIHRLASPGPARVALLAAPAGYGKTMLLHAWAAQEQRPVLWHDGAAHPDGTDHLELLADAAEATTEPLAVVVDAPRLLDRPKAAVALARLAQVIPPGSLLVLATRGPAPRPIGGLRARGEVLELGVRELALTDREAAAALRALGLRLGADPSARLLARLEGWPVAVMLAGLSLAEADRGAQDAAAAAFGGADAYVAEYVRDELVAGLDPALGAFLRRCSVVEWLSPEVCAAVTGRDDAGAALDALRAAGVPLVRGERDAALVRCHPLVREALAGEHERAEPAAARRAHLRAAAWFEEHAQSERAIEQLLAAGDLDDAAAVLWRLAASHAFDERAERLDAWLGAIAPRRVERHAGLAAVAAARELGRGRLDHARRWADLAATAPPTAAATRSARRGVAVIAALTDPGDLAGLPAGLDQVGQAGADADPWRALTALAQGSAAALIGNEDLARRWLAEGVRAGIVEAAGLAALCEAQLAMLSLTAGDSADGASLAERARSRVEQVRVEEHGLLGLVVAATAFARAHRGRFEEARADVALVHRVLVDGDGLPPWLRAELHLAAARAELRLSDLGAGREDLRRAAQLAARVPAATALRAWIAEGRRLADAAAMVALPGSDPLTAAELRVLGFLPSHLSFREIGGRLYVSPNTIKTQAHAVYRKLGAVSRSEAVDRATLLGLLDPDPRMSSPWDEVPLAGAS